MALLPAGAEALIVIDMERLRKSGAAEHLFRDVTPQRKLVEAQLGFDIDALDRAVIGYYDLGRRAEMLVVLQGRMQRQAVLEAFARRRGADARRLDYRGVEVIELGLEAAGFLTERTFIIGSRAGVRRAIDRGYGIGAAADNDNELAALWQSGAGAGAAVLRVAAIVTDHLRGELRRKAGNLAEVRRLSGRLDLEDGLELSVIAEVRDVPQAERVEQEVQRLLEEGRAMPALKALELVTYLDVVTVLAQGPRVLVAYRVNQERLEDLLVKVKRFIELRKQLEAKPS
jgi:hypothetical protein